MNKTNNHEAIRIISFEELPLAVCQLLEKVVNIERLLLNKNSESTPVETEEFLTIEQAAKFLSLSVPTIYGLNHQSKIPVCKIGKRLYFSKKDLVDWLKTGRKKTSTEIKNEADDQLAKLKKGVKNDK